MDAIALVSLLVTLAGVYLAMGLLFALFMAFAGVGKIDPAAKEGTWGFRLLIIPGMTVFWPMMLMRLIKGISTPPVERNQHRDQAGGSP
jgi:hypothetical protein